MSQQEALAEQLGAPEGNLEMTAENFTGNFNKFYELWEVAFFSERVLKSSDTFWGRC